MNSPSQKDSGWHSWPNVIRHDYVVQVCLVLPIVLAGFALLAWWSASSEKVNQIALQKQTEAILLGFGALAGFCIGIPIAIYRVLEMRSVLSTGQVCEGVVEHIYSRRSMIIIRYIYGDVEYRSTCSVSLDERLQLQLGDKVTLVVNDNNPRESIYVGQSDAPELSHE